MKSKAHTVFCLLAICASFIVSQNLKAQDFLEPDSTFISKNDDFSYLGEYYYALKKQLFPEEWTIGYLAEPSFFGEYGLFLIRDSNGPMLVLNRFDSNYWYSMPNLNKKEVQITVSRDTIRISTEEADRLTGIITDAIDNAVEPDSLGRLGFDGTTYYFMLPVKMATIWSPKKESECWKLVNEFEKLKKQFPEEQRRIHEYLMYERHNIYRFGLGYSTSLGNTPVSSGIGQLSNKFLSFDLMYRRFYIGSDIFNFVDGITLKAGFSFIEREIFRMTAFVGSYSSLAENKDEQSNKSKQIQAGMFADFRLYSCFWGPITGIELSAGIYASKEEMKSIEPPYSLNASLSLLFTFDLGI
jgi:hypothetical protein